MIGCGTTTFTDPDEYRVRIPGASVNVVLTGTGNFKARLTWVNLPRLTLVRAVENLPRIAFVSLPPGPVFVSFATRHHRPVFWHGVEMQWREIILHGDGERVHQRSGGGFTWGLMTLAQQDLARYGRPLARLELAAPRSTQFLLPRADLAAQLHRLHRQACHLVETKPDMIAHKEVARALEHDLLQTLINCLTSAELERVGQAGRRRAGVMARFEDVLASHSHKQVPMPELCAAIAAEERTLRICCAQSLGMSPGNYARLRRLNLVRSMLRRADPAAVTVAEIARRYGFSELGRFAGIYRDVFGEPPSTTLRQRRSNDCDLTAASGIA
jgi:AraC-like DNA-binding protein